MGSAAFEESLGQRQTSDDEVAEENAKIAHAYQKLDTETKKSYNSVAQMMDNQDMQSIMAIFAEKLLMNLFYSKHDQEDSKRIINITLDAFQFYCGAISTCRLLANTELMQQIIRHG